VFSPLPSFKATSATQMINSSHQVPREHSTKRTTRMEDARSFRKFVPSIPAANNILHTRVESTFRQTYKKSKDIDLGDCVATRKTHCQNCPDYLFLSISEFHSARRGRKFTSHAGIQIEGRTRVKRMLLGISPIT
jgi:hypothetical protein